MSDLLRGAGGPSVPEVARVLAGAIDRLEVADGSWPTVDAGRDPSTVPSRGAGR